jgi:hypothetical protein
MKSSSSSSDADHDDHLDNIVPKVGDDRLRLRRCPRSRGTQDTIRSERFDARQSDATLAGGIGAKRRSGIASGATGLSTSAADVALAMSPAPAPRVDVPATTPSAAPTAGSAQRAPTSPPTKAAEAPATTALAPAILSAPPAAQPAAFPPQPLAQERNMPAAVAMSVSSSGKAAIGGFTVAHSSGGRAVSDASKEGDDLDF